MAQLKEVTVYEWRVELLKKFDRISGHIFKLSESNAFVVQPKECTIVFQAPTSNYKVSERVIEDESAFYAIELMEPTYIGIYNLMFELTKDVDDLDSMVQFFAAWDYYRNNVERTDRSTKMMINDFLREAGTIVDKLVEKGE